MRDPAHIFQRLYTYLLFSDVWLHRGVSRLSSGHSPTIIHSLLTIFYYFRCLATPGSLPSLLRSLPDHHPQPPHLLPPYHLVRTDTAFYTDGQTDS